MNETFNINRFWLLVRRQWAENKKAYFLLWGMISFALIILALISQNSDVYLAYSLLFSFGGCYLTKTFFSRWTDFGRSSFFILLPASGTEKFLCALFYGILLYIPLYILNYFFCTYIVTYGILYFICLFFPNNLESFSSQIMSCFHTFAAIPFSFYLVVFILTFFLLQSLCMIIMIRFKKNQILIFLISLMAFLVLDQIVLRVVTLNMVTFPCARIFPPGFILTFFPGDFSYMRSLSSFGADLERFTFLNPVRSLNGIIWILVYILFYISAWSRIKEREL